MNDGTRIYAMRNLMTVFENVIKEIACFLWFAVLPRPTVAHILQSKIVGKQPPRIFGIWVTKSTYVAPRGGTE
jgi:hypothetical protein